MKKISSMLLIILIPWMLSAQVSESFSDGNFHTDPHWMGDTSDFSVNTALQLQLQASDAGSSYLSVFQQTGGSIEWQCQVRLAFSPSDNNCCRFYLMSDQQDLEQALNGYYVQLGASGSDDAPILVRQTGNQHVIVCEGTKGSIAAAFIIRLKVIRSPNGSWSLFSDPLGGTEFQAEASGLDLEHTSGNYFGVLCKYTSSNNKKFYFDDIYSGPPIIDSLPPALTRVSLLTANSLQLEFSEGITQESAANPLNYLASPGIGNPVAAQRDASKPTVVYLAFHNAFEPDTTYHLSLWDLSDAAGNRMDTTGSPFQWHQVHAFEVLINEIMCDPDPPVDLPNFEYLELINRSSATIELKDWIIRTGTTSRSIPEYSLEPGAFVVLCDDAAATSFGQYGPVISFSSLSLSNSGTSITLMNSEGGIVHTLEYDPSWYRSDYKAEGGWSLEMIDPLNPCGEAGNWRASDDASGGTPGRVNSVRSENPDHLQPSFSSAGFEDPLHLLIVFSEPMDSLTIIDPMNYTLDHSLGNPLSVEAVTPDYRKVILTLAKAIDPGVVYSVTFAPQVQDCAGNLIKAGANARVAIPANPEASDIVINEVLFNPRQDCPDFIEIYNRSWKVTDLKDLLLASYDTLSGSYSDYSVLTTESRLLFPGDYLSLTTDTAGTRSCHTNREFSSLFKSKDLPSLGSSSGSVALLGKSLELIDLVTYDESMHYPLLRDVDGVSLERVNPDRASGDRSNWHSASEASGFATPGYQNSQFGLVTQAEQGEIRLAPEVFSPDNDGFDDILMISYSFKQAGCNATVRIYNQYGQLVRNLVNNELCGTSGSWSWDGIDNRRSKASIGRYVVLIEVFNMEGDSWKVKKMAVLGGFLKGS